MSAQIQDLVRMGDSETLLDLMEDSDDWMMQLDAAEGLAQLGERDAWTFYTAQFKAIRTMCAPTRVKSSTTLPPNAKWRNSKPKENASSPKK